MNRIKKIKDYFHGLLEIIFSNTKSYQYSLKKVDVKIRDGKYDALIKYILIGSRRIQQEDPLSLLSRRVFTKFNEEDAEIIITVNTAITLLNCPSKDVMSQKLHDYLKKIHESK